MTEAEDGVTPRPRPSPFLASASARPPAALLGLRADVVETLTHCIKCLLKIHSLHPPLCRLAYIWNQTVCSIFRLASFSNMHLSFLHIFLCLGDSFLFGREVVFHCQNPISMLQS
ncbi:uncharacterized protein LOC121484047 isoform X2 [Vulpes lagopus]|uniref:uncharacterized protein LOC121484047 isoform X2 n=1 Tax=Vulpes lagopus TaxID=494514 RepID=UPI001BC9C1FB|nr:uncharacterized protein LOC121484047 isoform X2 [Vulpes lagopus]